MSIVLNLPPAIAQEAQKYAAIQGTTLERMLVECLKVELERRRKVVALMAKFDALVEKSHGRLNGTPYKFNRADAYEPEIPYA
ncbi:MAG: hypothetical protein J6U40_03960 [Kiritimatiellae bacterium]|nr:hypothetical protein [Kiritimatiellia bacterium]MBP5227171.1 hypothetical protein [Kiritimatiellia bacterium]